jgi:RimJ/RimL family protein N-acetyltransferase
MTATPFHPRPLPVGFQDVLDAPPSIRMKLASPHHATFIHRLRVDPTMNRHLSQVTGGVEGQARFLERYASLEAMGSEYYFVIINRKTDELCGTVRLYDIRPASFCRSSWILATGRPRLATVESAFFLYDFGFGCLGFPTSHFDVRKENTGVIAIHERMGVRRTGEDDAKIYFELTRETLERQLPDMTKLSGYRLARLFVLGSV